MLNNDKIRFTGTGEPALTLAVIVTHALHDTILEARKEFGYVDNDWVFVGKHLLYTVNSQCEMSITNKLFVLLL